ncbi:MAG: hypothetical protein LBP76_11870 [Treponema sp.]|jgi:hypothetical protein|nr:hypothetical protein [Treponema sp.]
MTVMTDGKEILLDRKDSALRPVGRLFARRRPEGRNASPQYIPCAVILLFSALFLFSCVSKKAASAGEDADEFALLASGGTAYFFIDMVKGKELTDVLPIKELAGKTGEQFLARTATAVAALYPEGASRRFLAAARGAYPGFWGNMSLAFSSAWKKVKSSTGKSYWYSAQDKLSVFLQKTLVFVSDADPLIQAPDALSPPGFRDYRQGAAFAGWVDEPEPHINQFLDSMEIPIKIPADRMFFAVFESAGTEDDAETAVSDDKTAVRDNKYDILLRMETPTETQAKALLTLFSMARYFYSGDFESTSTDAEEDGSLFLVKTIFAQTPAQDGPVLNIRMEAMDKDQISLLFKTFLVYSKKSQIYVRG